ncbi:site-specific DNA-methyltransferase [Solemya velum gill symbiont]|uniref:Methyltransferase n=1 Tax=Solemya velum gill symbiont TaxID=2340 RepID=A0A1T2CHS3_SOVGS|nr:site-specific DNA-methyltransferase [Solemya velum gill symbiont]OOY34395.1 DNA methylase N-4 [Solemya velum gill symbiont]OOY37107.1 DNA methylase N-4 [Solemya velum gill symbiont]OOY43434.1 DNA methylase N-4 [Solemya velum gill symbiont]
MQLNTVESVEHWSLQRLIPYAKNARTHDDTQVSQIAGSIAEFGFVNPILVGDDNVIIAGHGRLMAAQQLGLDTVPVIVLHHLTEAQRRALVIADNKIAENAGWNDELLKLELEELGDLGFDLDVIGFSDEELDELLGNDEQPGETDEDDIPEVEDEPVSRHGDVWILGDHRLLCGDSTSKQDLDKLMSGELADMAFTDPPYNVDYGNNAKDKMRGKDRRIMNDNLGDDFYQFLKDALTNLLSVTKGACYIAMSSSELDTLQKAFRDAGGKWSTFIVWAKNTFTLGRSDYQRQYEPILYGWREGNDHFWCGARDQGDVWFFNKPVKNDLHPTMKPVELVERALRNSSKSRDIVLDLFGGSGSTLIACEKTGRAARLIELDPKYVDVIVRRWQDYSGEQAIRASDDRLFDEVALESQSEAVSD